MRGLIFSGISGLEVVLLLLRGAMLWEKAAVPCSEWLLVLGRLPTLRVLVGTWGTILLALGWALWGARNPWGRDLVTRPQMLVLI